jgi:aminocarboxymuconate-semialdehyde decarboxylase
MPDRRGFLKQSAGAAAGVLFASSSSSAAAREQSTGSRRQVMVAGRRVRTVDVHCHCIVPGALELMGQPTPTNNAALILGTDRLRYMDEQGIDVEAISINPSWYASDRDVARKVIAFQNAKLAEFCTAHPDRFVGFATVSLQHPDLAAAQLEEGISKLGLRGGSIGASVNGEELASPRFDPFWAKAEELGALLFMHPQGAPELRTRLQGNGVLTNVIGNPLDTTIALSHLIFEGTLDRFPGLRICAAHGGGYLPSYVDRSDHGCLTFPEQCTKTLKKHPAEYLRQLYVDSLIFSSEALRHLIAECGVSQIMMGTDYPFPWTTTSVNHILNASGLDDSDKIAILGGNAAHLLKLA